MNGQNRGLRRPEHGGALADTECVRRIAQRDAEAVGDLYDRHATAMYSLALRILQQETEARHVIHDVFVEMWRTPRRDAQSDDGVAVELLALTRQRAIDRLRAEPQTAQGGHRDGNGAEASRTDRVQCLRAIEMIYFEGLSQREVAAQLAQPIDAVKNQIREALGKLRAALTLERE